MEIEFGRLIEIRFRGLVEIRFKRSTKIGVWRLEIRDQW